MAGRNQRKKGSMIREVCSADIKSVEQKKITPSQITTGIQYLRKERIIATEETVAVVVPTNEAKITGTRRGEYLYNLNKAVADRSVAATVAVEG
jgi:transglutaminase/protease-like cytokinesis protein 3